VILRLIDVVQDPLLGWLSERCRRAPWAAGGGGVRCMALAMLGLFAVDPPIAPLLWFALTLTVLFSAFSFLTITFYAEGVAKAARWAQGGHLRLAGWREGGALLGVCARRRGGDAAAALTAAPFTGFAWALPLIALVAAWAMRREWGTGDGPAPRPISRCILLADRLSRGACCCWRWSTRRRSPCHPRCSCSSSKAACRAGVGRAAALAVLPVRRSLDPAVEPPCHPLTARSRSFWRAWRLPSLPLPFAATLGAGDAGLRGDLRGLGGGPWAPT
jgi:hypothetical protein